MQVLLLHLLGEYFYAFWGGRCRGCLLWGSPLEGEVRMVLACFPKPRDILGEYLSYIGCIDQVVVRSSLPQFPIALELECLVELLQSQVSKAAIDKVGDILLVHGINSPLDTYQSRMLSDNQSDSHTGYRLGLFSQRSKVSELLDKAHGRKPITNLGDLR